VKTFAPNGRFGTSSKKFGIVAGMFGTPNRRFGTWQMRQPLARFIADVTAENILDKKHSSSAPKVAINRT